MGRRNWTACDQDPHGPSLDSWEVDLDLEDKILQNEAEGVLASLVAGRTRWHQLRSANGTGLFMPPAVAQATRDFEETNDHVVEFIHACVNFGEGRSVPLARVNKKYKAHRGPRRRWAVERYMSASWRMRWPTVTRSRRTPGTSTALTSLSSHRGRVSPDQGDPVRQFRGSLWKLLSESSSEANF